jgi:hypothetical protein
MEWRSPPLISDGDVSACCQERTHHLGIVVVCGSVKGSTAVGAHGVGVGPGIGEKE